MANTKPQLVNPIAPVMDIREEAVLDGLNREEEEKKRLEKYKKDEPIGKASMGDYIRIFSYATKLDLLLLVAAALASVGAGITLPLMNIVFGNLVGSFSFNAVAGSISPDELNNIIDQNTLYIVYLFMGKFVLCYVSMFSFRVVSTRLSAAIRLRYLQALFSQSISKLDRLPSGAAAQAITSAANTMQIGISEKLGTMLQYTALVIAAYVIAFKYSWQLTLVTSSSLVFVCLVYSGIIPISIKLQKSIDHANGKATAIASETLGAIRMVVACGAEDRVAKRHSGWIEEARRRGLKESPLFGFQMAPVFFCIFATFALTFWFGVRLFNQGIIDSVGTVLIVLMSVLLSVMSLGNIVAPITAIVKSATAASTFFEMIDRPTMSRDGLKDPEVSARNNLRFENVTFAYPSRPHVKILDNFNVEFESGKLTAIVGPSGSGKSTVVGLIERWYELTADTEEDPFIKSQQLVKKTTREEKDGGSQDEEKQVPKVPIALEGDIFIGEHNLKDVELRFWRSQIGLVQQEPFVFNDTIFANVAYGLVGSKYEDEDETGKRAMVEEACKEAFADEFITRLPLGYDTPVGESGMKLSGGQRQRLAIARAIIKRPQILIFDEATSAIDVRSERVVQAALDRVAKDRTTITIAHRLSTIRKADKIIVVAKGKVVEQGSHDELLKNSDGVYHNLVHAQQIIMGDGHNDLEPEEETISESLATRADAEKDAVAQDVEFDEVSYKGRDVFQSFGLLVLEQKRQIPWLLLTLLGSIGASAAIPTQAYLMASIIGVFSDHAGDPEGMANASAYWALTFVYLAIGIGFAYFVIGWSSNSLSVHVANTYRQQYFESIVHKNIRFFDAEENSTGTLVARVSNDPTQLQELLGLNMGMVYIAIFSLIACVSLALAIGWKLALVAMCAALPITMTAGYFRLRYEIQFEKMNAAVFAESSKFAAEAFGAVRTVASLTLEELICDRYSLLLRNHVVSAERKARYSTFIFALSDSVNLLCMSLTFWYGGRLIASHEYNYKQWLIIYTAIINGSESAGQWMSFGPNIAQASAAANRILSLRETRNQKAAQPITEILEGSGGVSIDFQDVHFTYPTRDIPIFASLNMSIKKGQFAALVGASGCGKSTIISLLEQFYRVRSGSITIDGINIASLDIKEYRKLFSLVAQEATLFQGTLRENILLGVDDDGSVTDENIYKACRDAEIHDFIMSLPDGYSTDIGSKGIALSGGQKQRIAIARALIRDPQVLLLDEATSSLDSESEKLIQAALEKAAKHRTTIAVAHRLATIQNAEIIFVLGSRGAGEGARVLEQGTHGELLAKRGVYYQMCQSQALDR